MVDQCRSYDFSLAEARTACPSFTWKPIDPAEDPTFPKIHAQREAYVLRLLTAMQDHEEKKDKDNNVYEDRWGNAPGTPDFYDRDAMETQAWGFQVCISYFQDIVLEF